MYTLLDIHSYIHTLVDKFRHTFHACGLTPHAHVGLTREPDVRREPGVRRNIASRVRAHASRFSQT